jgi:hypothetical protein
VWALPTGQGQGLVAVVGDEPAHLGECVGVAFRGAAVVVGGEWGGFGVDHGGDQRPARRVGEGGAELPATAG